MLRFFILLPISFPLRLQQYYRTSTAAAVYGVYNDFECKYEP